MEKSRTVETDIRRGDDVVDGSLVGRGLVDVGVDLWGGHCGCDGVDGGVRRVVVDTT